MEFIDKTAPWLTQDPKSLIGFRNYVVSAMETIDFALGNQRRGIQGSVNKLDFDMMKEQVSGMVTQLAALAATLSALTKRLEGEEKVNQEQGEQITRLDSADTAMAADISALAADTSAMAADITALGEQITQLGGADTAMAAQITALEARVAALEQGGQAPTTPTE